MKKSNKKITTSAIALMGGLVLGLAMPKASSAEVLRLYNWTDYTSPELLAKFTKETGIKVQLDTYDSNETLLAKIKSGGGKGYDIFLPSENFLPIFVKEGLIQKVDIKSMANYKYLDKRWRNPSWDPTQEYSVPYQFGITSFAYQSSVYKGPGKSWKEFFEPDATVKGKLAVFKSPDELVGGAAIYLGMKLCSEDPKDYQKIQELLIKQKPFVKVYSSEQVNERLKSGEVVMTHNWDGNTKRAQIDEGMPDVKLAFPKEGAIGFLDSFVINKTAPNPEAAKKFLNFVMDPQNMAIISNAQGYNNPISASYKYLSPSMKKAQALKMPGGYKIFFPGVCSGAATKYRDKVWTTLQK